VALTHLGLIKTSLLDYPGRVAATVFTHGCNLRCPWCHNGGLVRGPLPSEFKRRYEVLESLKRRKMLLEGVAVTGGEPLYHQDLASLLFEIQELGLAVKLDTNGTYPRRLALLPTGLVDFVAMDLKNSPARYYLQGIPGMDSKIVESVHLIQERYPRRQFRTTWVPVLNQLSEIPEMARVLGPGESLSITGFRNGKTLDPGWVSRRSATADELLQVAQCFSDEGILAQIVS